MAKSELGSESDRLPARVTAEHSKEQGSKSNQEKVWLRISGFLSLKAPATAETYAAIIKEWCEFLGAEVGSNTGATKLVAAEDLHAIAYRKWLEKQPGEKSRLERASALSSISTKEISKIRTNKEEKRDGLQSTLANSTIAKKFAALRRIYRVLAAAGVGVTQNPFDTDKVPPPPHRSGQKRPTEMVDFKLVKKIIDTPDSRTPKGVRDRALLATLFGAGLRRSEVVNLRVGDLRKTSQGTYFLHLRATKARKDADQTVPEWTAALLSELLKHRLARGATPSDFLFVSFKGKGGVVETKERISDNGLYRLFKEYCRRAGAGEFLTPHSARATAITKLLADGIPHREVQEFSRHSSVQMVELYDKRRIGIEQNPAKKLGY